MLDDDEKILFRRLAVFSGGFTLDLLESVCGRGRLLPGLAWIPHRQGSRPTLTDGPLRHASDHRRIRERAAGGVWRAPRDRFPPRGQHSPRSQTRFAEESNGTTKSLRYSAASPRSRTSPSPSTLCSPRREREMWRQPRRVCACCGDLNMYWHIRGKNLTAREISKGFLEASGGLASESATAAALKTAALGAWALGQIETANQEWQTACDLARSVDDAAELCICAMLSAFGLIGVDGVLGGAVPRRLSILPGGSAIRGLREWRWSVPDS